MSRSVMPWYRDREIVRQLPLPYRAYAFHGRLSERTGIDRGAGFLFRLIGRAYELLGRDPVIGLRVGSFPLFIDVRDRRIFWALDELRLDTPESTVIRSLVSEGDTFIDIGANHGTFSVAAVSLVGHEGLVLAFEPQPRLAPLIYQSLTATGTENFEVFDIACSDSTGALDLYVPWILHQGSGSASVFRSYSGASRHARIRVRASTLDSCLRDRRLPGRVFIKMDVEGSELAVLRGARRTIESYRPVILFEMNAISAAAAGRSPSDTLTFLQDLGYEFAECDRFPATVPASALLELERQRNLVALPIDRRGRR